MLVSSSDATLTSFGESFEVADLLTRYLTVMVLRKRPRDAIDDAARCVIRRSASIPGTIPKCVLSANVPNSLKIRYPDRQLPSADAQFPGSGRQMHDKWLPNQQVVGNAGLLPVSAVGRDRAVISLNEIRIRSNFQWSFNRVPSSAGRVVDVSKQLQRSDCARTVQLDFPLTLLSHELRRLPSSLDNIEAIATVVL